jgi:hypothetical protein
MAKIKVTFYNRYTALQDGNVKIVESLMRHMTERNTNISQNIFLQPHIIHVSTQNCHQSNLSSLFCQIYGHLEAFYLNIIMYITHINQSVLTLGSKIKKNRHMVIYTFCLIFFLRVLI